MSTAEWHRFFLLVGAVVLVLGMVMGIAGCDAGGDTTESTVSTTVGGDHQDGNAGHDADTDATTGGGGGTGQGTGDAGDGGATGGVAGATVDLTTGVEVEFELAGVKHTALLVRIEGASAEVVVASDSPTTYVLTEGQTADADLDADGVADSSLALTGIQTDSVTLHATAMQTPAYDETGFATQGGLAPYKARQRYECDPNAVVLDDQSLLLFYTSLDTRWVVWEQYLPDGTQVTSPQLGAGRVDPVPGAWLGDTIDVARVGDRILIISEMPWGIAGTWYDLDMQQIGQPALVTTRVDDASLATGGGHVWVATQSFYAPGAPRDGRDAVQIIELAAVPPTMPLRTARVTEPPTKADDVPPDMTYDEATGKLVVLYERTINGTTTPTDLRLAIVDAATLVVERDIAVASVAHLDDPTGAAVWANDGVALVFWRSGGAEPQHLVRVDLQSGAVTSVINSMPDTGIVRLQGNNRDLEFIQLPAGPALLFHDPAGVEGTIATHPDRFVLQPLDANGLAGEAIVLNGGQPVLADITFDLASLRANPKKAICGSPCLLSGTVINRGSLDARKVTLEVLVDGSSVGMLDLGTISPGDSKTFAKVWDVPADFEAEQVQVEYRLITTVEQYTLDNDSAEVTVQVRQKGLVQGRVTDASGVVPPEWWAAGLPGVTVSFGGKSVLTDAAGTFAIEEVEFGAGTLTATKEGYNPVSLQVETTRTRPIASVGIRMDNHGTLRLRVVDADTGLPLKGVQVFVLGYGRTDKTGDDGELVYAIPRGTYLLALKKTGYQAVPPTTFTVQLGTESSQTIAMREATTAQLSGRVVDAKGLGVAGAIVTIENPQGETVATPAVDANGDFASVELSTKPSGRYVIVATGNGLTVEEPILLSGGEIASVMVELVPDRGELAERQATEGYTSWMLKAAWPGFLDVGGQSIYVWYGNYAIRIGAQYWDGSRELSRVGVTAWGGTYETHVTKGEIEFDVSGDDLTGNGGKKLPPAVGEATDATNQSWWKTAGKAIYNFYDENKDAFDLAKQIYTGIKDVQEAWSGEDEWIVLGQGPELLTWKQSLEDFNVRPSWDWEHPLDSVMSIKEAIPTSFAIPIVIGGSSVQETAVRVDGIDVVDKNTGEVYFSDARTWYSYQGVDGDSSNSAGYEMTRTGIDVEDVRILVWVTVQKYWMGAPGGTCFDQRERQVVVFDPGNGGMKAIIAPGDTYKAPERWTTAEIERLIGG